jgi:H+-translocating NAD(P) transhydrogenase subunit alpha
MAVAFASTAGEGGSLISDHWPLKAGDPDYFVSASTPGTIPFLGKGSWNVIVGVAKEIYPGERRVALTPMVVPMLAKAGLEVAIESGAGVGAGYPDAQYQEKGAKVLAERAAVFAQSDIVAQVLGHGANDKNGGSDLGLMRRGQVLVGFLRPMGSAETIQQIAQTGVTAFAVELMPRTTRAQSMDALSSMASLAGYKAVLAVADALPRIFPMMTTAAGTLTPARVLVIGVGGAGLQAIATAKRLGAVISAYDVRPAVKEQVQSLGARFVELALETQDAQDVRGYAKAQDEAFYAKQRELLGRVVAENDAVITTAVVPGKKAPVLVTAEMVKGMAPGSVVLDMAAERGGNCELTKPGETYVVHGVTLMGPMNLASGVPHHASQMYARNLTAFLVNLVKDGKVRPAESDEIIRDTLLTQGGEVVNARVREALGMQGSVAGGQ